MARSTANAHRCAGLVTLRKLINLAVSGQMSVNETVKQIGDVGWDFACILRDDFQIFAHGQDDQIS